jgi:hypothetical protein
MSLMVKFRNWLDKKFPKKCDICKQKKQVRVIESMGRVCFDCYYRNAPRRERRRLEKMLKIRK